ncbi:MAG TPA: type II toxin-antitoxin system RelE/ParE family toxin [Allosphingosinicella sp.]|nr:type II toxin-antitoxin system RelE/ParE family toxin [Allosphingosinicella sp.]
MHTVVETPEYLKAAKSVGMTDEERAATVDYIAENPETGDIIEGTGGARKVRIPKQGKGKSGGYRVVTYYMAEDIPVFLVTVISKGQQANLSEGQKKAVKASNKEEKNRRREK